MTILLMKTGNSSLVLVLGRTNGRTNGNNKENMASCVTVLKKSDE